MEIEADVSFQRGLWTAQRIGWFLIGATIIAALLGAFGGGPLSRASARGDGFRIEYERFGRLQQSMALRFSLSGAEPHAQIALSRRYLESFRIEQITPLPRKWNRRALGPFIVLPGAG